MEKPVEIVEKCGFSTAIPGISNSAPPAEALYRPVHKRLHKENNKIMSPQQQCCEMENFREKVGKMPNEPTGNRLESGHGQNNLWKIHKFANGMIFLPREILKKNLEPRGAERR